MLRDAEARERSAQAEATATKMVSDAIEAGSSQSLNYFIAQKYVEAVGLFATSPNAKTILFPVEATQLIGTLGGIGELAREALGQAGAPAAATPTAAPHAGPSGGIGHDLARELECGHLVARRRDRAGDRRADRAGLLPDLRGGGRGGNRARPAGRARLARRRPGRFVRALQRRRHHDRETGIAAIVTIRRRTD